MTTEERIKNLFETSETPPDRPGPKSLPKPSEQQLEIINAELAPGESLKVEAKAGSGKTTCMLWLSHNKGPRARILYICFGNKGAAEAREKYAQAGISNTKACTVHALATATKGIYEAAGKFQTKLTVKDIQRTHPCTHRRAWEILETIKVFVESDHTTPKAEHVPDLPGLDMVAKNQISREASQVWGCMLDLKSPAPLSYDHYLKIYELTCPKLNYDYILLDEAQDSNPLTLSILQKQRAHCRIVLIGDSHQGIYKWRGAKDAMQSWEANYSFPLTESFRFGKEIAAAANTVLKTFCDNIHTIRGHKPADSLGPIPREMKHTLIARTNATLFDEALSQIGKGRKYHFVGTREENGWDPSGPYRFNDALDVLRLYTGDRTGVRNPHIKAFDSYNELKDAAAGVGGSGGDKELESLCRIVEKHTRRLPELIAKVVENCTSPEESDMELVTCHRAKGLEWPRVRMADDFTELVITDPEEGPRLARPSEDIETMPGDYDQEEINLIYVAITRAMERLEVNPRTLELFKSKNLLPLGLTPPREIVGYVPSVETRAPRRGTPAPNPNTVKIPFNRKDEAKIIARSAGGRLLWSQPNKTWTWDHPLRAPIPEKIKALSAEKTSMGLAC